MKWLQQWTSLLTTVIFISFHKEGFLICWANDTHSLLNSNIYFCSFYGYKKEKRFFLTWHVKFLKSKSWIQNRNSDKLLKSWTDKLCTKNPFNVNLPKKENATKLKSKKLFHSNAIIPEILCVEWVRCSIFME